MDKYDDRGTFRYAPRFRLRVQDPTHLGMNVTRGRAQGRLTLKGLLLDLETDPKREVPWLPGSPVLATLLAFQARSEAESAGHAFVRALLWTSIACGFPVMIEPYGVDNFELYDRARSEGDSVSAYATRGWPPDVLASEIEKGFAPNDGWSAPLQLSMELLAGSRLEASGRARFVIAVSAIEPLFGVERAAPCVLKWVDLALQALEQATTTTPEDVELLTNLKSRIAETKTESKTAAIRRIVAGAFPGDKATVAFVVRAYGLRSKIVHTGANPSGLDADYRRFAEIMRRIYSLRLGFAVP